MFKNKKAISIILCIGIVTSGFSGIITTYAQNNNGKVLERTEASQPKQNITELLPEVNVQEPADGKSETISGEILYQGVRKRYDPEGSGTYQYNIGSEDIKALLESGFTIQDILEADEIGNEIYIDPMELLAMKKETAKSFEELKAEVIKKREDDSISYLKNKYKKDMGTLQKEGLSEDEIISFLISVDSSGQTIEDGLIKEYKRRGTAAFQPDAKQGLSEATKKKYGITDKDAGKLTEELVNMLEQASKDTDKPVKELIQSFLASFKN